MYTPIQAVLDSRHDASERRSQLVNKASLYLSLRRFAVCIEHLTHQKVSKPRHSSRGIVQDLSGGFPNRLILPTNSKNVVTKFILVYLCRSMMQCGGKKKQETQNKQLLEGVGRHVSCSFLTFSQLPNRPAKPRGERTRGSPSVRSDSPGVFKPCHVLWLHYFLGRFLHVL